MKDGKKITASREESTSYMNQTLPMRESFDLIQRDLMIGERVASFYFINGLNKDDDMLKLMDALLKIKKEDMPAGILQFMEMSIPYTEVELIEDFDQVHALWMSIKGFGIRSVDDSREGVERFLKRNPNTSVVAEEDGKIVGAILCGHDGRRGCLYHVCVDVNHRMKGIGKAMVVFTMEALKKEGINKVSLIAFTQNDIGNAFWKEIGWTKREDLNYYDFTLNEANITAFIQ